MKVLHVITTINRGGAENHLMELVRGQVGQGLRVNVAYLKGDGYWTGELMDLGVPVRNLWLRFYGELKPLFQLRKLIGSVRPDIIHVHMPPAELYTRLALMLWRFKPVLVISKHNDEPFYRGVGQRIIGRWVARRAARVIAISEAVNLYVRNQLHIPAWRVITVHYGINPEPFAKVAASDRALLREQWQVPADAWVLGTVARLVPQKALHVLLHGYAQYLAQAKVPSRLILVGQGPLDQELKALAQKLEIEKSVVWAGFREDIPTVMRAFDAFALTSVYEGFGLVLLEAMAAGLAIAASAVSAIPEIVQNGETGLLCPAGNADSLARALLQLEDSSVRQRFGAAGFQRVTARFTVDKMVESTLIVYRNSCQ